MENLFGWVDYTVVAATLLFSILIGLYYGLIAKQATNDDLLLGGKSMGIAPIAASMLVTYLSAVTVLGYPAEVYGFGIQIFMNTIVYVCVVPFSVYFFMNVFYKMQLTSVYEYLEHRFESRFVRLFASFIFILQMCIFMGVCLFAPSIAMSAFMGVKTWQSIVGLGLCATVYTSIGGLKAVVWTDVFQLFMILAGMFAIIIQGFISSGGIVEAFNKAEAHGRLDLFEWKVDFFQRHNTLNFFLGQGFTIFCLYGTHQPQVQRYCSLPSFKHAVKATIFAIPLNCCTVLLCMVAGVVIYTTYAGCDPFALGTIGRVDSIVPYFVIKELQMIPGLIGLFTACVFSASLSTLSSGLNSLAAVLWEDFLKDTEIMKNIKPAGQARIIRMIALLFGAISILLAFVAQNMGSILSATLTAMGALSGPLGAVFAMGILMPFINRYGAISGMTVGFVSMVWITCNAFMLDKSHPTLSFFTDECMNETLSALNRTIVETSEVPWPEKIYTVSYIMYSFVGGMITFVVATIVSLFTCGFCNAKRVKPKYLHPLLRKKELCTAKIERDVSYSSTPQNYDKVINFPMQNGKSETDGMRQSGGYYSYNASINNNYNDYISSPNTPGPDGNQAARPLLYRMPSYNK